MSDWGKGVINNIGWGQGANNDIGWGSIYDKSNAGETLLSGGGFEGMLNLFPNASLGLSLDKLDKNYTGSAIKVRRPSDNAELNIGFVNGILDIVSLLNFVGFGNGFVSIIYDQVGSNNMVQNLDSLQGQIVFNGSVILEGGKPCIIRSADDNGGYLSTYAPNDGVAVKGVFYVGDGESKDSIMFGSQTNGDDFFLVSDNDNNTSIIKNITASNIKLNGADANFTTRANVRTKTDLQFLLYAELDFNFGDNVLGLGYQQNKPQGFGMFTFQELVIFENTNDTVAKENNINERYNIY